MNSLNSSGQKTSISPSINISKIPSSINLSKIPSDILSSLGKSTLPFKTFLRIEMATFIPWIILLFICTFIIVI